MRNPNASLDAFRPAASLDDDDDVGDALTEVSSAVPSLVSDATQASFQDKYGHDAVEHLAELLSRDSRSELLYVDIIATTSSAKFSHMHDQLLKLYFKDLRLETKNSTERGTLRLLQTSRCRRDVTSHIQRFCQPLPRPDGGALSSSLAERKVDRSFLLNRLLQGVAPVPHENEHVDSDDYEGHGSDSSISSTDLDPDPVIKDQQTPLRAIEAFLTGGTAFPRLLVNLACIGSPPGSLEEALHSDSVYVVKRFIARRLDKLPLRDQEEIKKLRLEGFPSTGHCPTFHERREVTSSRNQMSGTRTWRLQTQENGQKRSQKSQTDPNW